MAARLLIIGLVVVTCTLIAPQSIDPIQNPSGAGQTPDTTTTSTPRCEQKPIGSTSIADTDASGLSIATSLAAFDCALAVVIAGEDSGSLMIAAQLAAAAGGPLLVEGEDTRLITDEVRRVNPDVVYMVGDVAAELSEDTETMKMTAAEALGEASALLGGADPPGDRRQRPGPGSSRHRQSIGRGHGCLRT